MYTKQHFGIDLKKQLLENKTAEQIGAWAHSAYYDHISEIDPSSGVRKILLCLDQFARSYEELHDIADCLIAGEDVKL